MTLKLDRSDCTRLAFACTALQQSLENEAADPATSADRRTIAQISAADVRRRQKADYMRRLRAQRREAHKLEHEQNELLRQRIRALESTLRR